MWRQRNPACVVAIGESGGAHIAPRVHVCGIVSSPLKENAGADSVTSFPLSRADKLGETISREIMREPYSPFPTI